MQPRHDGCVHGVGRGEVPVEKWPCRVIGKFHVSLIPDVTDARDVGLNFGRSRLRCKPLRHHHRAMLAQVLKTGVHLSRNGAGMRTCVRRSRPNPFVRELLCKIFQDGQRLPDGDVAINETRHFARRRNLAHAFWRIVSAQLDERFLKCDALCTHDNPWPERPGRIDFIADVEVHRWGLCPYTFVAMQLPMPYFETMHLEMSSMA